MPELFRGHDRIIEIVRRLGAREYVNSPGGRLLYDRDRFAQAGIALRFLSDYAGPSTSILARILAEEPRDIAKDIRASAKERAPTGPAPGLKSAP